MKIDKNVPFPKEDGRGSKKSKYQVELLKEIGDSTLFECNEEEARGIRSAIISRISWLKNQKGFKFKFTSRIVKGGVRVWRIS